MRKSVVAVLICFASASWAQPWMPANASGPVKFSDALDRYAHSQYHEAAEEQRGDDAGKEKESSDHFFKSWEWYWRGHLDANGFMVPPAYTLQEWQRVAAERQASGARTTLASSDWVFQGPDVCTHGYSGLGRINVITFDPVDSNTFYVGAAAGSTWKTTDGGLTWTSLYENLPTLGVADIKVNPLNPRTIYVATGDGDAGDAYGSGVIVSHNGGATWSTTGLTWLPTNYNTAHSLLINPLDTNVMLVGSNAGIFKSYNHGVSWTNVYTGNFKQILYNPADTSIVYGSMYIDTTAQIMRSSDGGNTWSFQTTFPRAQRICLAVCQSMPSLVKAVVSNQQSGLQGVYTSEDNGSTFAATFLDNDTCGFNLLGYDLGLPTSSCGGQGWYDLCIAVNPANPAQVIVGGVNTYYSSDSGNSWQIANQWWGGLTGVATVHADKHWLAYNPLSGTLYETCDGGVYKNYGPLTQPWTDLTDGITITEFYRNAVDNRVAFCIGGCQDNGTKMVGPSGASDLTGGDGMQPLINYGDPSHIWYCAYQNGSIDMTRDSGVHYHSITDTIHSSGAWVTPYVLHPSDTGVLLLAYDRVYMSPNNGLSWTAISPQLDTVSGADMTTLAVAPSNPNYIYTTYFDYNVWRPVIWYTSDFGLTWNIITNPCSNSISDLVVDPKNPQRFWITVSGYGVPKIYQYYVPTNTWTDFTANLPDIPVQCMVIDTTFGTKYVGTDAAVYYRDTTMPSWQLFNTNLPTVQVDDLNINYTTNQLWGATFGRGMWSTTKAEKQPVLNVPTVAGSPVSFAIVPNPNQGVFNIRTTGLTGDISVSVIAADGKTVWQGQMTLDGSGNARVSTINLPAGFYFCELKGNGGIFRSKLVIND